MQKPSPPMASKAESDAAAKPKAFSEVSQKETEATHKTMLQSKPKASSKIVLEDNAAKPTHVGFPSSPLNLDSETAPKSVLQAKPKATMLKATAKARFSNDGPRPPPGVPPGEMKA